MDDDTDINIDVGVRLLQFLVNVMLTYEALAYFDPAAAFVCIVNILFNMPIHCTSSTEISNVGFVSESCVRYVSACHNGRSFHVAKYTVVQI